MLSLVSSQQSLQNAATYGRMSCLGSRTPGVKDTPFLGSTRGAKEAGRRLLPGEPRRDL